MIKIGDRVSTKAGNRGIVIDFNKHDHSMVLIKMDDGDELFASSSTLLVRPTITFRDPADDGPEVDILRQRFQAIKYGVFYWMNGQERRSKDLSKEYSSHADAAKAIREFGWVDLYHIKEIL